MFGEYGNGFNQYPPMQQQSQYPFIQQKPAQFTPQPQQPVVKPPAMLYTVNTQRILDKLCDMESNAKDQRINSLQLELQSATNQLSNLAQTASIVNQLRPTPIPAYTVCSPYQSYGNYGGCNGCC